MEDNFNELREQIGTVISELDESERRVIVLRFGIEDDTPLTLKEVNTEIADNPDTVREMESDALRKIRDNSIDHDDFYKRKREARDPFFED